MCPTSVLPNLSVRVIIKINLSENLQLLESSFPKEFESKIG